MDLDYSDQVAEMIAQVDVFMKEHIYPRELDHWEWIDDQENLWQYPPWFEDLKAKAREAGIWNWFLNKEYDQFSPGLSNLEFAPIMEHMGRGGIRPRQTVQQEYLVPDDRRGSLQSGQRPPWPCDW